MYCRKCGTEIPDDSLFCVKCGTPVESVSQPTQKTEQLSKETEEKTYASSESPQNKKTGLVIACVVVVLAALAGVFALRQKGAHSDDIIDVPETTVLVTPEKQVSIFEDKEKLAEVTASVLMIECYDITGEVYATGSGFVAFESNLIVTNYHVIEDHPFAITALSEGGKTYEIDKIVAYNEEMDIAILKTNTSTNLVPLSFAEKTVEKTDKVIAVGSPLGLINTVSDGIVGGFTQVGNESVIQFTASISHGSSGGVLLNESGEVVGVTFASFSEGQNLNVAIPINYVEALYKQASPAREITVQQFFDEIEHTYPIEYVINNKDAFIGKTVIFKLYISSVFTVKNTEGFYPYTNTAFLVEREEDVLGLMSITSKTKSKATVDNEFNTYYNKEWNKIKAGKGIEIFVSHELAEWLFPGYSITVTGILVDFTEMFPEYPVKGELTLKDLSIRFNGTSGD